MKFILIFIAIVISGCSASGPLFTSLDAVPENKSLIYFYRPETVILSGVSTYMAIDNKRVSKLKSNGYSVHVVDPGEITVEMSWDCSLGACLSARSLSEVVTKKITINEGESRFFRVGIDGHLMGNKIIWGFYESDEDRALKDLKKKRNQGA